MKMDFNKNFLHTFRGGKFDVWNQIFSCFPRNLKKRQFCFEYFSVKTAPTEVMEYSRTEPAEKPSKQSPQIFYFWCFVTEIFRCKVPKIWKKILLTLSIKWSIFKSWDNFLSLKKITFKGPLLATQGVQRVFQWWLKGVFRVVKVYSKGVLSVFQGRFTDF